MNGKLLASLVEANLAVQVTVFDQQATLFDAAFDRMSQLLRVAWLKQVITRAAFQSLNRSLYRGVPSRQNDVRSRVKVAGAAYQLQATDFRHHHISQNDVNLSAGQVVKSFFT